MDATEKLLQELTDADGIPGYENEVRGIIRRYLEPLGEIDRDKTGSLICRHTEEATEPRIMLAGHMDEIGFMVQRITKEGFIKFIPLGGWWDHVLMTQRVRIRTSKGNVIGVIGAKPPHVLSEEERKKLVPKREMYIDIGTSSQEEVEEAGVRIGDPIVPISEFTPLVKPKTYLAKAFDDRVGCALLIETLQNLNKLKHPNSVFGVATAQEEVGLRGATTSVDVVDPDVALVLEGSVAGDVPGLIETVPVKLGGGPLISFCEARMIPNTRLRDLVLDIAKKHDIPLQISASSEGGGATEAAVIHLHKSGVPTLVVSVPCRHIHSHTGIIHRDDFDHTVKLLTSVIQELDNATVASLTEW